MNIITRKEAEALGRTRYFTGKPCTHGHISERQTANGACLTCVALKKVEADKRYRAKHLERIREHDKTRSARPRKDKDKLKATKKRHYEKHKAIILAKMIDYRAANKEQRRQYFKKYKKENAGKVNALAAKREAAYLLRTPSWLTDEDHWWMKEVYELSALRTKITGVQWHVDHIVPMLGKQVSGLHVPSNLRVILGAENVRKNNRWFLEVGG